MRLHIIAFVFTAALAYAVTPRSDDASLTRNLVGSWQTDPAEGTSYSSVATYKADGSALELIWKTDEIEGSRMRVTSQWSISDGVLVLRCVDSSDPSLIPIGLEIRDRIISMTDDRLVFEALDRQGQSDGQRHTKLRKKSA